MSEQQIVSVINEQIVTIRDQFFAGKAALDTEQRESLLQSIDDEMRSVVEQDLFATQPELINLWKEIFESAFTGQLASHLAQNIDPDHYYKFGEYLSQKMDSKQENVDPVLKKLVYGYLDIFRLPAFLTKIYGDSKWEGLIHDLLQKSNFTIWELFQQRVRDYGDKTLFKLIRGSMETDYTWRQVDVMVESYRLALGNILSENWGKVAFLMENSLQMALLDIACLTSGVVNVMIPANSVAQHIKFILNQTEAPLLLVSNEKQLMKIKSIKKDIPHLKTVVLLQGDDMEDWVIPHREFVSSGAQFTKTSFQQIQNRVRMDSLATIMYTSGTTGEPKGIMFSQMNIVYKRFCRAMALPEIGDHDRFLSYLPLYHTFGRWLEMMGSIFWGATYGFMENPSVDTMIANMQQLKPTVFISIPKKWLQLYEVIDHQTDLELEDEQIILQTIRQLTGGKLKWGLSAAGYLAPEIFQFFQKYGIELMSGFGMTEATGGITMTPPGQYRSNSLGKALPGIELKLAKDGELLVRGPYVMLGYYDEDANETFTSEGWLPTGDIMRKGRDGFVEIVDRKKEIYKNIKGETIAPQKIENYFRDVETIHQIFLVGDHRPYNTVLICPNTNTEDSVLANMGDLQKQEFFSSIIVSVNKFLAPYERIVDFRIIDRAFSADKGELTPKGTFKRRVIEKNFSERIEGMYTKNYTEISLNGIEIRIPNWFLREKGCLSKDIIPLPDGISIPKLQVVLKIEKKQKRKNIYRIGDYYYKISTPYIDFHLLLTNPIYWLGNHNFFEFAGDVIILWYRQDTVDERVQFHSKIAGKVIDQQIKNEIKRVLSAGEQSLYGLHYAVLFLQSENEEDGLLAVQYIRFLLEDESLFIYKLAWKLLHHPELTDALTVRRNLLKIAIQRAKGADLQELLQLYLEHNYDIIDENITHAIVEGSRDDENLEAIENVLGDQVGSRKGDGQIEHSSLPSLFHLLSRYGIQHPSSFRRTRRIIAYYQLFKDWPALLQLADKARTDLHDGFRNWLGNNQTMAVDVETGKEYRWEDVITMEPGIDPEDRDRIVQAITETSLIRAAIFLFSKGTLIRLNNILPGGIWVSHLRSHPDKIVYRLTVQTRFQGSYEIMLNLNKTLSKENVEDEVKWLILADPKYFVQELVDDFGNYWEEFDLWTAKFVPGHTVAKFLQRESRKGDNKTIQRLYNLWPFFIWNTAASYYNFWKLTQYRLQLANPSPDNYIVPTHDYQTGTRIISFSETEKSSSLVCFFDNYYKRFIQETESKYPFLKQESIWNYLFSGVIKAEGEQKGIEVLKNYYQELLDDDQLEYSDDVAEKLRMFLQDVEQNGFIPKQLFFAIKRFHRWYALNQNAELEAQAQTLHELYKTYRLLELEKDYPETRTRFYLETAFHDSSELLKKALKGIINVQRVKHITKEDTLTIVSNIQTEFDLTPKEHFFLTRLSYPHLKPSDSAEILKMKGEGEQVANLVVRWEDYDGNPFYIRKPISPKEISRLHQLFIDVNLQVHFRPQHQFLVAISERGYIIGGLFYLRSDHQTVHLEKIVISDRYRRKGISEGLMNEFFNRMKSEQIKFITTGFFRPEYLYRFGFKIESKYSGLVKELSD